MQLLKFLEFRGGTKDGLLSFGKFLRAKSTTVMQLLKFLEFIRDAQRTPAEPRCRPRGGAG
jgi:hypothetical protein